MRTIILTVGPPAIGKSSWAFEEVKKSNGRFKRLNLDDLREALGVTSFNATEEKHIQEVMYEMGRKFLLKGYDIIADNTNLSTKSWDKWNEVAKKVGDCLVVEKHFDSNITLKELFARNKGRDRKVPEDVIARMYSKWTKYDPNNSAYHEGTDFQDTIITFTNDFKDSLPEAVIVDLDGTMALKSDRNIFDWSRVYEDDVNVILDQLLVRLAPKNILFVSGRSDACLDETKRWLKDKTSIGKQTNWKLYMKPKERESEKDTLFKESVYKKHIMNKYAILAVFDDRDGVVNMWRNFNLPVYQVWYGDF